MTSVPYVTWQTAKAEDITFLGPLLGSIMRPFGGKLADRHGGAMVTTITFASMIAGGGLIVAASVTSTLWLFNVAFVALFVLTGIGNGSIYKMIPTIFRLASPKRRWRTEPKPTRSTRSPSVDREP